MNIDAVSSSFFRPKNGHELLHAMKNNIRCEIVDTHAFIGAKMLEENLGASFCFKLSETNKGWTLFKAGMSVRDEYGSLSLGKLRRMLADRIIETIFKKK